MEWVRGRREGEKRLRDERGRERNGLGRKEEGKETAKGGRKEGEKRLREGGDLCVELVIKFAFCSDPVVKQA